ncbi:MAG: YcxB family protein [Acutalibacteraceae bacterium]
MKEIASVTYLTTKEDYISFKLAEKAGKTDDSDKMPIYVIGGFMLVMGLISQLSTIRQLTLLEKRFITVMFVVFGVFLLAYYDFIKPLAVKMTAERFCGKNGDKLVSNTITVYDSGVKVHNDRYTADIPINAITGGYENNDVIVLYHSVNDMVFIPKRGLGTDKINDISTYLSKNVENYKIKIKKKKV